MDKYLKKDQADLDSQAAAEALRLSSELEAPKRLSRRNLHEYRLKVKELRYELQLAPSSEQMFVDDLGKVKDAIGEWHDWEELVAIANDVLDHGPGCNLVRRLKEISNSKYEEALRLAENLRNKYLRVSARKRRGKQDKQLDLAPPVLAATFALSRDASRQAA